MKIKKNVNLFLLFIFYPLLLFSDNLPVKVYHKDLGNNHYGFYADNNGYMPYTVKFWFSKILNFNPSEKVPFWAVIPAGTEKKFLLKITPVPDKETRFYYNFHYYPGDCLNAKHDDSYLYLIPFEHGTKQKVSQAYNGGFSHFGNIRYAIDFLMPVGTGLYAARGGTVIFIKEDSNIGGLDMKYAKHGNYIEIYHEDGTKAQYMHLKKNGAVVEVGDKVKAGGLIGYSGNTGRSGGPHLHFQVQVPECGEPMQSIPTKFINYDLKPVSIEPNTYYYATHPGKEKYKMILGDNLKNEDFSDYLKKVKVNKKISVRYQNVDDSYLFFAQNGFNKKIEINLTLTLTNMIVSKPLPVKVEIPSGTEKFLCFIKPRRPKSSSDYEIYTRFYYNYSYKIR